MAGERKKVGLIAGWGEIPSIFARSAAEEGVDVVAVALSEEALGGLEQYVATFRTLSIAEYGELLQYFREHGVEEIAMVGKVKKDILFQDFSFDEAGTELVERMRRKGDNAVMQTIVNGFEQEGFTIIEQTRYLKKYLAGEGVLNSHPPGEELWKDIRYAMQMARRIAALDIGQTVVAKHRSVLAVEAMEGTDKTIKRGSDLGGGRVIVAKAAWPEQDFRFDIPTLGLATLENLSRDALSAFVVEADKTLLLNPEEFFDWADTNDVSVVGMGSD